MLNVYLVCEWKMSSADDWSSDCRSHGCVSCVQFPVRIRSELCWTPSPRSSIYTPKSPSLSSLLHLYSQISIWMCESGVCWRFSQSAANGSIRMTQWGRGPPHAQWGIYCTGNNELLWQAGGEGCITGRKFVRKWKPLLKPNLMLRNLSETTRKCFYFAF